MEAAALEATPRLVRAGDGGVGGDGRAHRSPPRAAVRRRRRQRPLHPARASPCACGQESGLEAHRDIHGRAAAPADCAPVTDKSIGQPVVRYTGGSGHVRAAHNALGWPLSAGRSRRASAPGRAYAGWLTSRVEFSNRFPALETTGPAGKAQGSSRGGRSAARRTPPLDSDLSDFGLGETLPV